MTEKIIGDENEREKKQKTLIEKIVIKKNIK